MYKIIFLFLSSKSEFYDQLKELQKLYLQKYEQYIKYFFVEFNNNMIEDFIEIDNTLYFKGEESINPGMITKTSLAIKYINNNYNYDFLFRTNLSTVLHIENIFNHINRLPNNNLCSGFNLFGFITGTGVIMHKNVAELIANTFTNFNYLNIHEDVLMSQIFGAYQIPYFPPNDYKWAIICDDIHVDPNDNFIYLQTFGQIVNFNYPSNILHFRIKNGSNRNLDIVYFKDILKKVYNINVDINNTNSSSVFNLNIPVNVINSTLPNNNLPNNNLPNNNLPNNNLPNNNLPNINLPHTNPLSNVINITINNATDYESSSSETSSNSSVVEMDTGQNDFNNNSNNNTSNNPNKRSRSQRRKNK